MVEFSDKIKEKRNYLSTLDAVITRLNGKYPRVMDEAKMYLVCVNCESVECFTKHILTKELFDEKSPVIPLVQNKELRMQIQ